MFEEEKKLSPNFRSDRKSAITVIKRRIDFYSQNIHITGGYIMLVQIKKNIKS